MTSALLRRIPGAAYSFRCADKIAVCRWLTSRAFKPRMRRSRAEFARLRHDHIRASIVIALDGSVEVIGPRPDDVLNILAGITSVDPAEGVPA